MFAVCPRLLIEQSEGGDKKQELYWGRERESALFVTLKTALGGPFPIAALLNNQASTEHSLQSIVKNTRASLLGTNKVSFDMILMLFNLNPHAEKTLPTILFVQLALGTTHNEPCQKMQELIFFKK